MDEGFNILQTLLFQPGEVTSCDFSINSLLAIGSSDKKLRVLEWKVGLGFVDMFYSPLTSHKYGITSVKFSPKGVILATSSLDGTAILFNVQTGINTFTIVQPNKCSIRQCEFTSDSSKLITAGDNGIFCFWDLIHHRQIRTYQFHDEEDLGLRGFSISPDSDFLISTESKGLLKLFFIGDIKKNEPLEILTKRDIHDGVNGCDFSSIKEYEENQELKRKYMIGTCGADALVNIWMVVVQEKRKFERKQNFNCTLILIHSLESHANDVLNVRFNSTGDYLATSGLDKTVKLWQVFTGRCIKTFERHRRFITCSVFSKDSAFLATGSNDKTFIIWNLNPSTTLDSNILMPCNVSSHFSNLDLINYFSEVKSFNKSNSCSNNQFIVLQKLNLSSPVNNVLFLGNNSLVTDGRDKTITIWKRQETGFLFESKEISEEHKYSVNYLDISPCGTKIISCSLDEAITFWNLEADLIYKMKTLNCTNGLKCCRFSPDSNLIAAAGDNQAVFLWDASNLEFINTIQYHEETITSLAFTPDTKFVISTCITGSIKLFSLEDNRSLLTVNNAHDLGVTCCDILTTAKKEKLHNYLLTTGGSDSLVKLWIVSKSELKLIKELSGHGGTIHFVKFSKNEPFVLASCSADNTIRIWEAESGYQLQVLGVHEKAVTTCSFSEDSSLLATGSLDKTVIIWSLTKRFYPESMKDLENFYTAFENWTNSNIVTWFVNIGSIENARKIKHTLFNGRDILCLTNDAILDKINCKKEEKEVLKRELDWLRKEATWNAAVKNCKNEIPHKFLCPIAHNIMRYPVICSDGYTYDRGSICEWFLSGKVSSPITKEYMKSLVLLPNVILKRNIREYFFDEIFK